MATLIGYTDRNRPSAETLRPADERIGDSGQRSRLMGPTEAPLVAGKCGSCGDDSCRDGGAAEDGKLLLETASSPWSTGGCPLGSDIRGYLKEASRSEPGKAYRIDYRTNIRPEYTGLVCPDNLCESACFLEATGHDADHIRVTEAWFGEHGAKERTSAPLVIASDAFAGKNIAVIGSGPATEQVIETMLSLGANVTVFDAADKPGGLLTRGLPGFKIDNDTVYRNHDWLGENGAEYRMNTRVGQDGDISFAELVEQTQADAVVVGIGTHKYSTIPDLKGGGKDAVIQAIPNLSIQNKRDDGLEPEGFDSSVHNAKGKVKIIVGGGDTAFDEVGTALRQGAKKIIVLVRSKIRALDKEVKANTEEAEEIARQRGVGLKDVLDIRVRQEIEEVHGTSDRVTAVTIKDRDGSILETVNADIVSLAVSSDVPDLKKSWGLPGLEQKRGGIVPVVPLLDVFKSAEDGGRGGPGGGLAGLFRANHGVIPVFAGGDMTRERAPLNPAGEPMSTPAEERALVVTALLDGRGVTEDLVYALEHPSEVAENYSDRALNF